MSKPAIEFGRIDVLYQGDLAFLLQVGSHEREGRVVPFERFGAVVAAGVIEQVVGDGAFNRRCPAVLSLCSLALSRRWFGSRSVICLASTLLGLGIQFGALGAGARLCHLARAFSLLFA